MKHSTVLLSLARSFLPGSILALSVVSCASDDKEADGDPNSTDNPSTIDAGLSASEGKSDERADDAGDDGNSDDGNSDDGNSDDGNSDDGNSDDGNSGDGNGDDGNGDDGNSDDGNSDDGNSDDGNGDDDCSRAGAVRETDSACGPNLRGVIQERCEGGMWNSSPELCDDKDVCTDEQTRLAPCQIDELADAGQLTETCIEGQWQETAACQLAGCTTGDMAEVACGLNGRGIQPQICANSGNWNADGECVDPDTCEDGTPRECPGDNGDSELCDGGSWPAPSDCPLAPDCVYSETWDDDNDPYTLCVAVTTCAAGSAERTSPSTSRDRVCAPCVSGTFCAGGDTSPVPCAVDRWDHDADASTECVAHLSCDAGSVQTNAGSATSNKECSACPAGQYCAGDSSAAMACANGLWDDDADSSTACVAVSSCPAGTTRAAPPSATSDRTCSPCSAGQYCAGASAEALPCNDGTWDHDADASTACITVDTCPAGSIDEAPPTATSNRTCTACGAGQFCAGDGAEVVACEGSSWDHDSDPATTCRSVAPCPAGSRQTRASTSVTNNVCTACRVGQYCAGGTVGAITCVPPSFDTDEDPATPCVDADEICTDSIDNDGDSDVDCDDADCVSHVDCLAEVCNNGVDDDGDSQIDCDDSECAALAGCLSCPAISDALESQPALTISGTTTGGSSSEASTCGSTESPDVTFTWQAPADGCYSFDTVGTEFDTTLQLRNACPDSSEVECNDDIEDPTSIITSRVQAVLSANATYLVTVDGYDEEAFGNYKLTIGSCVENCSNGLDDDFSGDADCDDSSCSAMCACGMDDDLSSAIGSEVPYWITSNVGMGNDVEPTCGSEGGSDVMYAWTPPVTGCYQFDTFGSVFTDDMGVSSPLDTILHIRSNCPEFTELDCNDDEDLFADIPTSLLRLENMVAGTTYLIVVDGYDEDAEGEFLLNINPCP